MQVENHRKMKVKDRIEEELRSIETMDIGQPKKLLAIKLLGAVDLAVEFQLITYKEWERFISRIFLIL